MNSLVTESDNHEIFREWSEEVSERYALASLRVMELADEKLPEFFSEGFAEYFHKTAGFIKTVLCLFGIQPEGAQGEGKPGSEESDLMNLEELLYRDLQPEFYGESFANPDYCEKKLGRECAAIASCVYTEVRTLIRFAGERNLEAMTIIMEFFLEIYCMVQSVLEDRACDAVRVLKIMQESLYYYVFDYCEFFVKDMIEEKTGLHEKTLSYKARPELSGIAGRLPIWDHEKSCNPAYEADHFSDLGLIFDHTIKERLAQAYQTAFDQCGDEKGLLSFHDEAGENLTASFGRKKSASYFNAKQERQIHSLCEKIRQMKA